MAQKIKRTVNIEYQAKGLKEIQQELNKTQIFASDSDAFKELKREAADFASLLSKQDLGKMSPAMAQEYAKKYEQIMKMHEKVRVQMLKMVDEESANSVEGLNEQIEATEKLIAEKEKLVSLIERQYVADPNTARVTAGTQEIFDKTAKEAGAKVLKPEDKMMGVKGKELHNPASFLKNMQQIDTLFGSISNKNDEINQKIANGEKLTQDEVVALQAIIDKAKERGELDKNFKITAEEIANQTEARGKVELEQERILESIRTKKHNQAVKELEDEKSQLIALNQTKQGVEELEISEEELTEQQKAALVVVREMLDKQLKLKAQHKEKTNSWKKQEKEATNATKKTTQAVNENTSSLGKAAKQVFSYGIAFTALRRVYRETIRTITELDAALTEMAVVTTMGREDAWELVGTFQELAKQTGFTTTEIAKLSTVYFRQGRTLKDVIELTTVAAKAARVAGISAQESADYLTSAVNGFGLAAEQALSVSDKFAALAASSASSYEELATGLSKFAAQANIAGMSIDFALGMLAKGVETTREAPETIGTALKTVIARMRELTDLGKTMEDGMDVNRVDKALKQVGVSLMDTNGQFRAMQDVLTDVGNSWATLNTNQRASVAVALAGTRQQSRLIAIMNDFDRTLELVETSEESAGATTAQHLEYMNSMQAAMTGLQTAWQQFITTITESEVVIGVVKGLSGAITGISNGLNSLGMSGKNAMIVILGLAGALKTYNVMQKITKSETAIGIFLTKLLGISKAKENKETLKAILLDKSKNAIGVIGNIIKKMSIGGIMASIAAKQAETTATLGATGAQYALNAAMAANPIGLIIFAVTGLVLLLVALTKGMKDSKEGTDSFASSLFKGLKAGFDILVGIIKGFISIFKNLVKLFLPLIAVVMLPLISIIAGIVIGFKAFSYYIRVVNVMLQKFVAWVKKTIPGFDFFEKGIKKIGNAIGKFFKGIEKSFSAWEQANLDATKSYEDLAKEIDKTTEKNIAENYELGKKNKTIEKLIKDYEELNSKEIKTEEDIEALENLREEIGDLNKEYLDADGTVNTELMLADIASNKGEIQKNLTDNAIEILRLAKNDIEKFLEDEGNINVIGALLNSGMEGLDLTQDQKNAMSAYYDNLTEAFSSELSKASSDEEKMGILEDMQAQANRYADFLVGLDEKFSAVEGDAISGKVATYRKELAKLSGPEAEALKELYPELEYLANKFGNKLNDTKFQNMFSNLDIDADTFNDISEALEGSGKTVESFMTTVANRQAYLESRGVSSALAFSQAWSEGASTLADAEDRVTMYALAAQKSTRDTAGAIDHLNSKIDRISETQKKFMSGDLSETELFEFLEDYGDMLEGDNLQKFMQGGNIGRILRDEIRNTRDEYRATIATINAELSTIDAELFKRDITDEKRKQLKIDKNGLEIQKNSLEILIQYGNELSRVSQTQHEYNAILEQYNRLKDIGADNDIISAELLAAQIALAEESINNANEQIADLEDELKGTLGENYKDYYDIINGVLVWNYEKLTQDGKEVAPSLRESYQSALDVTYDFYKDLMKASLEREKKIADEKKKIYQDYFDELDKLEEKRERKQSREDLVAQLQRLEGATDERSRQRAKELRQELNKLDEDSNKKSIEENRKSLIDSIDMALEQLKSSWGQIYIDLINAGGLSGAAFVNSLVDSGVLDESYRIATVAPNTGGFSTGGSNGLHNITRSVNALAYSKGGIVDYTGLAMVHGSSSKPEAFLNASQTEMFAALTGALSKISVSGGNSENISIGNITIQTNQLNNKQDFRAAGETLAEAFSSAINRRGLLINAKR